MSRLTLRPLLLTTKIPAVKLNSMGAPADPTDLKNPYKSPILIDEIRVTVVGNTTGGAGTDSLASAFIGSQIELMLGSQPLTNNTVPIPLLGKFWDTTGAAGALAAMKQNIGPFVDGYPTSVWRLKRPLYVPEQSYLWPRVLYGSRPASALANATIPTAADFYISYTCRVVPNDAPVPATITLPWLADWTSALTAYNAAAINEESTETDLANPHREPLDVDMLVGRAYVGYCDAVYADSNVTEALINVRMQDQMGNMIVRDPVPFSHLFNADDSTWKCNARLAPGGFYKAFVNTDLSSKTATGDQVQHFIGMHGYRQIAYGGGPL